MNRKFTFIVVLLTLALVTLACSLGGGKPEPTATAAPTQTARVAPTNTPVPPPTSPPATAEEEEVVEEQEPVDYDTVFPLPENVQDFVGEGGESQITFQTSLSIDDSIAFYREVLADLGLVEYEVLTSIQDDGFSLVFASWPNGEEVVVQGVDFDDFTNISIRLEEVVEGELNPPPPGTELGEELRSEMGGFVCQTIPGYTVEEAFGFASMEAPDADPDLGPAVLLIGSVDEESRTAEQLHDDFMADIDVDIEVSEPREITVGGAEGLDVELSGAEGGREIRGRIIFVAVSPTHSFTMFGAAPSDRWESELGPLFDGVVASLSFFEPESFSELPEEEEMVEGEEIRQWAVSAVASSEYGDPSWAASQATGAPDTSTCGDYETAWASAASDTVEWIELSYDTPIYPTEVNIVQSYSPDQVISVEMIDAEGEYHAVYLGEPEEKAECPYTLSIPVENADYLAVGVKITIDQSELGNWNEIDAVELVGVP